MQLNPPQDRQVPSARLGQSLCRCLDHSIRMRELDGEIELSLERLPSPLPADLLPETRYWKYRSQRSQQLGLPVQQCELELPLAPLERSLLGVWKPDAASVMLLHRAGQPLKVSI